MEYEITQQTVCKEPTPGKFYLDADGDLFLFVGDGDNWGDPWIEFNSSGAWDRSPNQVKEPLVEVSRGQYTSVIDGKVRRF